MTTKRTHAEPGTAQASRSNLAILKFINREEARYKKQLLALCKVRYCGDSSDRDDVTHEQAFNRGVLYGLGAVRDRLKGSYPVLVQYTGKSK
jgi:hypothetical protein